MQIQNWQLEVHQARRGMAWLQLSLQQYRHQISAGENRSSYGPASWILWKDCPRSGLALKKFIDVGAGIVDSNYRGELDVVLFNFSKEYFVVNMGDKIAQLIFEKIKTPVVKETDSLEETGRGAKGYGSTSINEDQSIKLKTQKTNEDKQNEAQPRNEAISTIKHKRSQLEMARQMISARKLQR